MKTTRQGAGSRALGLVLLCLISACGDETTKPPVVRDPRTILVPDEMDLEEAGRQAVAGDTLSLRAFFPIPPLTRTVTFRSDQTPLLIRGDKNLPLVTGTDSFAFLRFESPKPGTKIDAVAFAGGATAIDVTGDGEIVIAGCLFTGGVAQVHAEGSALTVRVEGSLFEDADLFGIDIAGPTHLIAHQNTILRAGDCGVRATGESDALLTANIIAGSANFGIACVGGALLLGGSGCNDVFESVNGPYTGCVAPETDFDLDPGFCNEQRGIYTLESNSPCAEGISGACGRVGARDVGCEPQFAPTERQPLPQGSR
jgi:hypothetical protein